MTHRSVFLALALALCTAPIACDDDDGGSDTSNDSAADTGNSGNDSNNDSADSADSAATSSSMETCMSSHECINDACVCTTPGMEDEECTDDEACVDECEVCM